MEQTTLNVKGMTCNHCKMAVTGALEDLKGIDQVNVDVDKGTADVTYDPNTVTLDQMREAVEEQGYDVA